MEFGLIVNTSLRGTDSLLVMDVSSIHLVGWQAFMQYLGDHSVIITSFSVSYLRKIAALVV